MTIMQLAKKVDKTPQAIYWLYHKLGRMPTLEECQNVKRGRPLKMKSTDKE